MSTLIKFKRKVPAGKIVNAHFFVNDFLLYPFTAPAAKLF